MSDAPDQSQETMRKEAEGIVPTPPVVTTKTQAKGGAAGIVIGAVIGVVLGVIVGLLVFQDRPAFWIAVIAFAVAGSVAGGVSGGIRKTQEDLQAETDTPRADT